MECEMERRFHRGFTAAEKKELWDRWKRGEVSQAEARDKALACRKLLLNGIDPIEERNAQRTQDRLDQAKSVRFRQCADS